MAKNSSFPEVLHFIEHQQVVLVKETSSDHPWIKSTIEAFNSVLQIDFLCCRETVPELLPVPYYSIKSSIHHIHSDQLEWVPDQGSNYDGHQPHFVLDFLCEIDIMRNDFVLL